MITTILGKTRNDKTLYIKNKLCCESNKTLIFDYKNNYSEIDGTIINLGLINPFLEPLTFRDAQAINAAMIEYQTFFENRCKEVLQDYCPEGENWETYKYYNLATEGLFRSLNSWSHHEVSYAKMIKPYFNFRKSKQTLSISDVVNLINHSDKNKIIIKTEGLHSNETRMLTYLLLVRYYDELNENLVVVSDSINSLWKDGHFKNLLKLIDLTKLEMYFSFSKSTNIPKNLVSITHKLVLFELDNNSEINELRNLGYSIPQKYKKVKPKEVITI